MNYIPNFHVLQIKYLSPTNNKGARVSIKSERFEQSISIGYNHEFNSVADIANEYLSAKGFNIIGKAESKEGYYLITDTFEPLK